MNYLARNLLIPKGREYAENYIIDGPVSFNDGYSLLWMLENHQN